MKGRQYIVNIFVYGSFKHLLCLCVELWYFLAGNIARVNAVNIVSYLETSQIKGRNSKFSYLI